MLDSAAADLAAAQLELAECQQQATAAANALAELEQRQEASRGAIMEAVASSSNLRNQLTQAEERLAGGGSRGLRLQAEMATADSQAQAFGGQRGQLALEFETVSQRVAALGEEIAQSAAVARVQASRGDGTQESPRQPARRVCLGDREEGFVGSGDSRAWLLH